MDTQQLEELESIYKKQEHDFYEYRHNDQKKLYYDPNRNFFYYVYTKDHEFIHGDETLQGLEKDIQKPFANRSTTEKTVQHSEWQEEHLLLLKKPIYEQDEAVGYIILGKSITAQHHFFQKTLQLLILLTCISTILIGLLSYYMAGKAMVPIQWSFDKQRKFVSDASHELRTPLSIFYSSLEILEIEENQRISTFGKELVQDMKEEAQLMKGLLDKLLFLARHDQQQWNQHNEIIQLSSLLEKIGAKFNKIIPPDIQLVTNIEQDIEMLGDATKIQELLYILLDNAILYSKEGKITLNLLKANHTIKITITDQGIGIPAHELSQIFERFYRSDTARQRNGTGLGLAIAKAIVEQHHGTITATSEVGVGTTFHMTFPINE